MLKRYVVGTNLTYYCDEGFRFAPQAGKANFNDFIICNKFGGWNGTAPDCVRKFYSTKFGVSTIQ